MKGPKCYRATVELLIRTESESGACDLMSSLLTENGVFSKDEQRLIDWAYSYGPTEITVPPEEQDLDVYFGVDNHEAALKGKAPVTEGFPSAVAAWETSDHSVFLSFRKAVEHEDRYQLKEEVRHFCIRHGLTGREIEGEQVQEVLLAHGDDLREILNR